MFPFLHLSQVFLVHCFHSTPYQQCSDFVCVFVLTHVIGVKLPDEPGSMAKAMNVIASNGYSVDYVYAFLATCAQCYK